MKTYTHIETGSTDTREGWISSYPAEELEDRKLTAEQAFDADLDVTLFEKQMKTYYNPNPMYGEGGPFDAEDENMLADEWQTSFETWANDEYHEIVETDMWGELERNGYTKEKFISEKISEMRDDFISGLEER